MTRKAEHYASSAQHYATKVPEVTLGFWIIKILATTLGETGGDTVTMTLGWGYLTGTAIFLALLIGLVIAQIVAPKFHPFLYWATIVASTTFGTTMADFADRSLGIGYTGGSLLLLICLVAILGALVLVRRHNLGEHREHTTSGGLLLGGDYVFPDVRDCAWGLDRRHVGPRVWRRGTRLRCRAGGRSCGIFLDECVAGPAVLDRVYFDSATRRHRWRFPRQTLGTWWARFEPPGRLGGHCVAYDHARCRSSAKGGHPSGREPDGIGTEGELSRLLLRGGAVEHQAVLAGGDLHRLAVIVLA